MKNDMTSEDKNDVKHLQHSSNDTNSVDESECNCAGIDSEPQCKPLVKSENVTDPSKDENEVDIPNNETVQCGSDASADILKSNTTTTDTKEKMDTLVGEKLLFAEVKTSNTIKNDNKKSQTDVKQEGETPSKTKEDSKNETSVCDNKVVIDVKIGKDVLQDDAAKASTEYREDDAFASDGDDEDSSSSDSYSSDEDLRTRKISKSDIEDDEDDEEDTGRKTKAKKYNIKTYGEIAVEDLPPLEELKITVDESVNMIDIGTVSSIVGVLVVIQGKLDQNPLDIDSVLFLKDRKPFGRVFETIGPVKLPFYSVRFNSPKDIEDTGVKLGETIYYAPEEKDFTSFVFVNNLINQKGSDASWEHNNEPPSKYIDYSDDEQERKAKAKNRKKTEVDQEGEVGNAKKRFERDANTPKGNKHDRRRSEQNKDHFSQRHQRGRESSQGWNRKHRDFSADRFEKDVADMNSSDMFQSNGMQSWPPRSNNDNGSGGSRQYCPPPRPKMIPDGYSLAYSSFRPRPPRFSHTQAPPRFTTQRPAPPRGQFQQQQQQQRNAGPHFRPNANNNPFSGPSNQGIFNARVPPPNFGQPGPLQPSSNSQQHPQVPVGQNFNQGPPPSFLPSTGAFSSVNTGPAQGQGPNNGGPFQQNMGQFNRNAASPQNTQLPQGVDGVPVPQMPFMQPGNNPFSAGNTGQNTMNMNPLQHSAVSQNNTCPPNVFSGLNSSGQNLPMSSAQPVSFHQNFNQPQPVFIQANKLPSSHAFNTQPNPQYMPPPSFSQQYNPQQPIGQGPMVAQQQVAYQMPPPATNAQPPPFGGPPTFGGARFLQRNISSARAPMVDTRYMNNSGTN